MYLQDSSPEASEMIAKIKNLIESGENINTELALQILEGGGVPPEMLTYLAVLCIWYQNSQALALCKEYFGNDIIKVLEDASQRFYITSREDEMSEFLNELSKYSFLNIQEFSNLTFRLTGSGAAFCLQHQTQPIKKILEILVQDNVLNLTGFNLNEIPEEIGEFTELTYLYLTNNNLTRFSTSLAKLKKLKYLYYESNPIEKSEIRKLRKLIPQVIAQKYFDEGKQAYFKKKYNKAVGKFEQAIKICPDSAEAWNWQGYMYRSLDDDAKALICYEKSMVLDPDDAFIWANMGEVLCSLNQPKRALEICEQGLNQLSSMQKKSNQDIANIWFIKGLAHFWLKEYTKSIDANDKAISLNNYVGAWYNKACSYSKQGNKIAMLQCLETSIKMDYEYWEMAEKDEDLDFEDFYEDEDFIQLKDKYRINN